MALQKLNKLKILALRLPYEEPAQVAIVKKGMWPKLRSLIAVEPSDDSFREFLVKAWRDREVSMHVHRDYDLDANVVVL